MELYIRSQDKMKLVSNCNLYISNEIRNEYVIEDLSNKYLKLGTYKTKERALEILDEIQRLLKPRIMMKYNDDCTMSVSSIEPQPASNVYQMPKE